MVLGWDGALTRLKLLVAHHGLLGPLRLRRLPHQVIEVHKILKFGDPLEKLVDTWHVDVATHLLLLRLLLVREAQDTLISSGMLHCTSTDSISDWIRLTILMAYYDKLEHVKGD